MNVTEKRDFDIMKEDVSSMKKDIAEIKTALLGDEYRREGIIPTVKIMEKRVADLQEFKKKVYWLVGCVGVISSFLFQVLRNLIKF